jgi:hypothetical protein
MNIVYSSDVFPRSARAVTMAYLIGFGSLAICQLGFAGDPLIETRVITRGGDPAPGLPGITLIQPGNGGEDGAGRMNRHGNVAFYSPLSDGSIGVFTDHSGELELVVRTGDLAPGTHGAMFQTLEDLRFADDGTMTWMSFLFGGDIVDCNNNFNPENDTALYLARSGEIEMVIREDDLIPGLEGDIHVDLVSNEDLNPLGTTHGAFVFARGGTCPNFFGATDVFLIDRGGGLEPLVVPGTPGPEPGTTYVAGSPVGSTFGLCFIPDDPDGFGFTATVRDDETGEETWVFVVEEDGEQRIKIRWGQRVDGIPEGLHLTSGFGNVNGTRNSLRADIHAYRSTLVDENGQSAGMQAVLLSDANDDLRLVALDGDEAPGIPGGATFSFVSTDDPPFSAAYQPIGAGDNGELTIRGLVTGPQVTEDDDEVMYFVDAVGNLHLVAREGDQAPACAGDVRFVGTYLESALSKAYMNRSGKFAFRARLGGDGLPVVAFGVFLFDPATMTLHKIIGPGDEIDLFGDGSDVRTVGNVPGFGQLRGGAWPALSDQGEMTAQVTFVDENNVPDGDALLALRFTGCLWDLDGSGDVGVTDFLALLAVWGQAGVPADFDGGGVGVTDFLILLAAWGPCP